MTVTSALVLEVLKANRRFDPHEIRPSAIGHCARQQVYRMLDYPADEEAMADLEAVAYLGHVIEENLADIYSKSLPHKTYRQFPIRTPYGVEAHPDIWVPALDLDIEVKNVSVNAKHYGLPNPEHKAQHMLRLHFHHKYRNKKAKGEIVYFFRETFWDPDIRAPHVIPLEYDPEEGQRLEDRLLWIMSCVNEKVLPEREGKDPGRYPCKTKSAHFSVWCPYRDLCWGDTLEETENAYVTDEEIGLLLKEYANYVELKRSFDKKADAVKGRLEAIENQLASVFDSNNTNVIAYGDFRLKRTPVPPQRVEYNRKGYYRYTLAKVKTGG